MSEHRFMKLAEEQQGFEYTIAYRDDIDHILGGKGDTCWYTVIKNGSVAESYAAVFKDGTWHDIYTKGKGKRKISKDAASGTTIRLIEEKAYLCQDEKWVTDRKPSLVEDSHPHFHYVYGFGDKALDVSEKYGVTIGFSDLKDISSGFHLRYLYTGSQVELPM